MDNIKRISNFTQRLIKGFWILFFDKAFRNFILHNRKIWKRYNNNDSKAEVLFEFTDMQPSIISYSYFSNVLAEKFNAKIRAYSFGKNSWVSLYQKKLYRSFNADVFSYRLNKAQKSELGELFNSVYSTLHSKNDVFDLCISGVWFGDLLYDSHMMTYKLPTVDINDNKFKKTLREALYQFIYWRDYFTSHDVKAINVTHCCYLIAIPLRVAIHKGIPAYQVNVYGGFYLSGQRFWAYTDFYDYPLQFSELSKTEQLYGVEIAKERIDRRFAGEVGVDMAYSTKSAYTNIKKDRVLSNNDKFKILIAAHCFFDSPNGLGPNLFIDFFEWFNFLGKISEKTDYEWYLKTHPDYLPGNIEILNMFIDRYPKFRLISSDTSHHQLIDEGIDCVLTTYGTIGWEYAAFGKLAINASLSCPHIAYNFNLCPKNIEEYENLLMRLSEQNIDIDINEIYEYYYMKLRRDNMSNWLYQDYHSYIKNVGGYDNQFVSIAYNYFIDEFTNSIHNQTIALLNNFIDSKDYCMQEKHYLN
ncbi:MAG: hypothetical protein KAI40_00150 [Desulfobacterales bacterium]|nr:hypothetical protein [Desulfobacterales bacterium]